MAKDTDKNKEALRAVKELLDQFCRDHLNHDYAILCGKLADKLARKRPSPLTSGKPSSWACGIVREIGLLNFLSDPSQTPHMKMAEVTKAFGVSEGTACAKAATIRRLFNTNQFDPEWLLPSVIDQHPLTWILSVNGFAMDIRDAPREAQVVAYEQGLIPYVPADRLSAAIEELAPKIFGGPDNIGFGDETLESASKSRQAKRAKRGAPQGDKPAETGRVYTLAVWLTGGPMTEAFVKKNPQVERTIEIRGDQTLMDLHGAIFDAFGREDEHLYEFQFGEGPMDPDGLRYGVNLGPDPMGNDPTGYVEETTLDSLTLEVGRQFGYWFDFGDDWWHTIQVEAIGEKEPSGEYPRVTKRIGRSPPQYG
ncbi:MAG: plasmid pRiA4b ORF-3 family protein [Planctomycetes bacterium]|nr:plasmid pRiA4b ORF-3 family protein [Planctomycetota bacterium]